MPHHERSSVLDGIASFSSCTRSELDLLSFIATEQVLDAGRVITVENAVSRDCFVIVNGRVRIERAGEPLGVLGPGEFVGELSLLTGVPQVVTVIAETAVELLVLSPAEFDSLLANAPSVVRKMLRERKRVVA